MIYDDVLKVTEKYIKESEIRLVLYCEAIAAIRDLSLKEGRVVKSGPSKAAT